MKKLFFIFIILLLCLISVILLFSSSLKKTKYNKNSWSTQKTEKYIKVINISGPISFSTEKNIFNINYGASEIINDIKKVETDPNNIALLVRINSPGGTVAASQEIYNSILDYKLKTSRPVICSMADMAASGGYYAAVACDTIFANSGSLTGSIGVIINSLNVEELFSKIGIKPNVFKSDKHKDILSPFRTSSIEEKSIINDAVQDVYQQFSDAVKHNRKNKIIDDNKIFDGRIFTGNQALEYGLIDFIGGYRKALEYTWKTCGFTGKPNIRTKEKSNFIETFFNSYQKSVLPLSLHEKLNSFIPVKLIYNNGF